MNNGKGGSFGPHRSSFFSTWLVACLEVIAWKLDHHSQEQNVSQKKKRKMNASVGSFSEEQTSMMSGDSFQKEFAPSWWSVDLVAVTLKQSFLFATYLEKANLDLHLCMAKPEDTLNSINKQEDSIKTHHAHRKFNSRTKQSWCVLHLVCMWNWKSKKLKARPSSL